MACTQCYKSALSVAHIAGGNNLVTGDVYPRMCSNVNQSSACVDCEL